MSTRRGGIKTTIGTIRSIYDLNGNYLPAGNYFFNVNKFHNDEFIGSINNNGNYGKFNFSPMSLIKMLAVGQSKLADRANLLHIEGMPNYPVPLNNDYINFNNTSRIVNYYPGRNRLNFRNNVVVPTQFSFNNDTTEREKINCRICLDDLSDDEYEITHLECSHSFCKDCLNEWQEENNTCPICRSEIKIKNSRTLYNRILERRRQLRK